MFSGGELVFEVYHVGRIWRCCKKSTGCRRCQARFVRPSGEVCQSDLQIAFDKMASIMADERSVLTSFAKRMRLRANLAIVVVLVLIPFVIHGASNSIETMRITPEKWVQDSHPEKQTFERFRSEFEGNDVVYVSWDGCTIDDPRLTEFGKGISSSNFLTSQPDLIPYETVITGSQTVQEMSVAPLLLQREEIVERLKGFLVGTDGITSCAVVVLTYDGNEHRRESIQQIKSVAAEASGVPQSEIIIAGPPHDGVTIDDESLRGINLFGALSTFVSALLCIYCLRSLKIAGVILGIACLGQGIVLSMVYYSGISLDAILIVAPPLIFVLTVSSGIHFVNYCRAQPQAIDHQTAVENAWKEAWKPCLMAVTTTAIGLCSLSISRISPIAAFGAYSGVSLLITVGLLMCLLPDALRKWPLERIAQSTNRLHQFSQWVPNNAFSIAMTSVAVALLAFMGAQEIQTSVDPTALFQSDSKIIKDYNWIEQNIGASVPVEIVVRFDEKSELNMSERVEFIRDAHATISNVDGIQNVMSAVTFLPTATALEPGDSFARKALVNRRLHAACDNLDQLNYLHEDEQGQSWRVTGRVKATEGVSFGAIHENIHLAMHGLLSNHPELASTVSIDETGMMPLIEQVQVTILSDLIRSLMTAFILIGITIFFVLKNLRISMLVTVLNTFPVLIIFGIMGGSQVPVDIGTMMTAAVAMGIAVDDTVHFLCFYRRCLANGAQPIAAARKSIQTCGSAMLQTSLICCSGMLVFALSSFVPTRQFGVIMAAILVAAILSDLIFLPALLLVGRRWKLWSNADVMQAEPVLTTQQLTT